MFVKVCSRFRGEIWVEKDGEQVNGKSIMGLMMLAAGPGCSIEIAAKGPEADQAVSALAELVEGRFDEEQ
jgi:phosphocarrier protein